jgi:putative endonuclease
MGTTDPRRLRGRIGEDAAADLYARQGFRLLARNWRCRLGELDLVVAGADIVVFCEVKTRTGSAFGGGFDAVTPSKQRKIRQLGEVFLASTSVRPASVRFDVASVRLAAPREPEVELFTDAF